MHSAAVGSLAILSLVLAPALEAQSPKKPKDEVTYQYMVTQFTALNARVDKLDQKLATLETDLAQLKQNQTDLAAELRDNESVTKTLDASLNSLRLSSAQDLLELKTDIAQTRQSIADLAAQVKNDAASARQPAPATNSTSPAAQAPATLEGYITLVDDNGITINLGSSKGVQVGAQFSVFKAADRQMQIEVGVIEITQVLDENNSKAKIIYTKPGTQFEFSDTVRLK
ncbi:MAG TPA: hypothetical protein VGT03_02930 [Candidatus Acidoferrales bacterium]|nr:hypothetical protein [Candidatus Acidoferrales bacterium]